MFICAAVDVFGRGTSPQSSRRLEYEPRVRGQDGRRREATAMLPYASSLSSTEGAEGR